jgi:hypothetical protein
MWSCSLCFAVDHLLLLWATLTDNSTLPTLAQHTYNLEFRCCCTCVCPQGLNVSLYWKNPDPRKYVNVVPTSAITGETHCENTATLTHLLR